MKRSPISADLPLRHGTVVERQNLVAHAMQLTEKERSALEVGLEVDVAARMIENCIGVTGVPLGVAAHFLINGREALVPMAIEEPSVVAAASHAAKLARAGGGFLAESTPPIMIAQVELRDVDEPDAAAERLRAAEVEIRAAVDGTLPRLIERGGGSRGVEARVLEGGPRGRVVVHALIDCKDAMGANMCNAAAEALAPLVGSIAGGRVGLRILSNLCDRRLTTARVRIPFEALGRNSASGASIAGAIEEGARFAELDPYRAATHNKGIFNGVDAVALACGQDWRAVEAAGHAFAARGGRYGALSRWTVDEAAAVLEGELTMPLAFGTVGGALRVHPGVRVALRIAGEPDATELAQLAVAAGLATNLAALRALSTEGIQRGHMVLHERYRSEP